MSSIDALEEAASVWLAREDRGLSDVERIALESWLAEDVAQRICYLRLKALWQRVDRLNGQDLPAHVEESRPAARYTGAAWRAMAAILLVGLIGAGAWLLNGRMAPMGPAEVSYATRVGQRQLVQLNDGTAVQLNTGTRLRARLTGASRVVYLDEGEAFFEVAKDEQRPFTVFVGNRRITDIGTKFSIRREDDGAQILVAEGRIRVAPSNVQDRTRAVEVGPGSIVLAKAGSTLVSQKSRQDIADRLSWREGILTFNQQTLNAAASEFNRYNTKHIVVLGAARNLRIGGRFKPENVAVFIALIKEGFGLKIEDTGTQIIVSE